MLETVFVAGYIGSPHFLSGSVAALFDADSIGTRSGHLSVSTSGWWKGEVGVSEHLASGTFMRVHVSIDILTARVNGEMNVSHGLSGCCTGALVQI